VWQLLGWLVPRAPNLAGVSFEMLEKPSSPPTSSARS